MERLLWIFMIAIGLLSCEKEEDNPRLSDNNTFEVSLQPYTLKAGEKAKLEVNIKSQETGFPITVYACPPFQGGTVSYASEVLPSFQFGNMFMSGSFVSTFLNSKDTTITIEFFPRKIYDTQQQINFNIYIKGNNSKHINYDENLGVQYASSYYLLAFDEPKIETFSPTFNNLTSYSLGVRVEDIYVWNGVYKQLSYGLCYSESTNPTINDNIILSSSDYVYERAKLPNLNKAISGLKPNTTYYFRPFVNNGKVSYGEELLVKTLDEDYLKDEYLELNVEYLADDQLTVKINSISTNITDSYTEYLVNYTLKNNTPDKEITESNFTIFSLVGEEKKYQTGMFGKLFPGESKTRSYTFKVLNSQKYHLIEYNTEFLTPTPTSSKLKWGLNN